MKVLNIIKNLIGKSDNQGVSSKAETREEIQLLNITENVFDHYRRYVKGNANATWEDIQKKITVKWMLGLKTPEHWHDKHRELRYYGNLSILVDTSLNTVVWIKNKVGVFEDSYIDKSEKSRLYKLLGLEEKEFIPRYMSESNSTYHDSNSLHSVRV